MSKSINRQSEQDAEYTRAYRAWVSNLPEAEQASLIAQGLAEPDASRRTSNYNPELALEQATANPWAPGDSAEDGSEALSRLGRDVAVALASFCARVRSHSNPLLAFDTLCFATGLMGLEGRTQRALAELHGVTNAAFSKQVIGWLDIFDLTPPRGCRSLRTRDNLSQARLLLRERRSAKVTPTRKGRRRNRYPDRSADPTVVFVRGLDLFRRWFRTRCRKLPLRRWSPEARAILRTELAWFARLHAELSVTTNFRDA